MWGGDSADFIFCVVTFTVKHHKKRNNRTNNAGAWARGGGGQNANEHIKFTVKAEVDLYLEGQDNYVKYHGLQKNNLEYYFMNSLENEDTPKSVQLQRGDTIMVQKKRKSDPSKAALGILHRWRNLMKRKNSNLGQGEENRPRFVLKRASEESGILLTRGKWTLRAEKKKASDRYNIMPAILQYVLQSWKVIAV